MTDNLHHYKAFIDGLLSRPSRSLLAESIRNLEKTGPGRSEEEWPKILLQLTPEQREVVTELVKRSHETAIFEAVVFLDEGYAVQARVRPDGTAGPGRDYTLTPLPFMPFGEEMHDDLVNRQLGYPWEDEGE